MSFLSPIVILFSETGESRARKPGKKSPFFLSFFLSFNKKNLFFLHLFLHFFSQWFWIGGHRGCERFLLSIHGNLFPISSFSLFLLLSLHRIFRLVILVFAASKLMAVFGWQPCPFR